MNDDNDKNIRTHRRQTTGIRACRVRKCIIPKRHRTLHILIRCQFIVGLKSEFLPIIHIDSVHNSNITTTTTFQRQKDPKEKLSTYNLAAVADFVLRGWRQKKTTTTTARIPHSTASTSYVCTQSNGLLVAPNAWMIIQMCLCVFFV